MQVCQKIQCIHNINIIESKSDYLSKCRPKMIILNIHL